MCGAGVFRNAYELFIHQVVSNLHVVVSMDPTNPRFLLRCESNPALYTRCAMLWMGHWRGPSMRALPTLLPGVAELMRGDFEDEEMQQQKRSPAKAKQQRSKRRGGKGESKRGGEGKDDDDDESDGEGVPKQQQAKGLSEREQEELLELVLAMHGSVPAATPLEYVSFLKQWKDLHNAKRGGMGREIYKLRSGLGKLVSARETVDELSANAAVSAKELAEAQVKADTAMDSITKTLSGASERRQEVKELGAEVAEKDEKTRARQEHIKTELEGIQPILDSAKAAVGGIRSDHLNEITALKMPPDAIADVLGAVLKLLGVRDVSWLSMKKFLRSVFWGGSHARADLWKHLNPERALF